MSCDLPHEGRRAIHSHFCHRIPSICLIFAGNSFVFVCKALQQVIWDFGTFGTFGTFFKNTIPNSQWDSQNPVGISMWNDVFLTNEPYCWRYNDRNQQSRQTATVLKWSKSKSLLDSMIIVRYKWWKLKFLTAHLDTSRDFIAWQSVYEN